MEYILERYAEALSRVKNEHVASILVLASVIKDFQKKEWFDSFGHELCLAIRHGRQDV